MGRVKTKEERLKKKQKKEKFFEAKTQKKGFRAKKLKIDLDKQKAPQRPSMVQFRMPQKIG